MAKIQKYIFIVLLIFAYFFPLFISLKNILEGSIPFWYDSARDILQAVDNLKKVTLIGPTSGIPGIFYGPHWIWFQSFPLIFSRDPKLVALIVLILPYFIGFVFLLYKLSKYLGKMNSIFLWLLFMYGYSNYTTYLWQPHLAPVFLLTAVFILINIDFAKSDRKNRLKILIFGIILGFLVNFHISFGIGVIIGSLVFLVLESLKKNKKEILRNIAVSLTGILIVCVPNILFEFRHDFLQSKALWKTLEQGILHNKAVVDQVGLSQGDILHQFFLQVPSTLLNLSPTIIFLIYFLFIIPVIYNFSFKKDKLNEKEGRILRYLLTISASILMVYLSTRNPVWTYHFVGVETIYLLLLGLIIKKIQMPEKIIFALFLIVAVSYIMKYQKESQVPARSISSLSTKQFIVEQIFDDSLGTPFVYKAYSSAIYTFDYDYLFEWVGGEKYGYVPEKEVGNTNIVYLIVPNETEVVQQDFANHKTPNKIYKTEKSWKIEDGTVVIKRVKI